MSSIFKNCYITRSMRARDTWLAINAKVDEVGGRWIRAGEDSRWEISTTS
ncbi:MAG: hypothetical protein NWE83_03410 [Candidatus Bathyarchaeota archaeon]|nr:hypothetical protein [Candidatus Bathyarchaeota archaeon]